MKYIKLGNTGISVSKLCFGTLTMGPLQCALPVKRGTELLEHAFSLGVNFLDTAEIYGTYPYIKEALRLKPDAAVSTKCYAYDERTAEESFRAAVKGIGREYIDIFMLHEQESAHTIRGHMRAIEYFVRRKEEGLIGAVGLSTHYIQCVKAAKEYEELSVLHPILNLGGIGIQDGTKEEMLSEMRDAHKRGKGIFAMKALGGGHLISRNREAIEYVLGQDCIDAVAVGMQSEKEIAYNCALFGGQEPDESAADGLTGKGRRLFVEQWCSGCGVCVKTCGHRAMDLVHGKARPIEEKCVFCGYCARSCPQFCIKVI